MKNEKKLKKEGQKGLTDLRSQKPLKKFEGKRQKIFMLKGKVKYLNLIR